MSAEAVEWNLMVDWVASLRPRPAPTERVSATPFGVVRVPIANPRGGGGTFRGEYDQTKGYGAGDTFIISEDTTIDGITAVAGYYGVPPAGTDAKGTWAGYVPANPTGNAVPQDPLPTVGDPPNDKFYARIIVPYC